MVELLEGVKPLQIQARATLAEVLTMHGRPTEALAEVREAMALRASLGKVEASEAIVLLVHAAALFATGEHAAACTAIAEARDYLLAEAARIDDPSRRMTFLESVPENARILSLAQTWGVERST